MGSGVLRVSAQGPTAERGAAALVAAGLGREDLGDVVGPPVVHGAVDGGAAALALMVQAAEESLDGTDLHITLHRP